MAARVILKPFAELGDKYNIPDIADDTDVSIAKGFTPIYSTAMSKGGKPPTREEMNGIFNFIFQHLYDRQVGLMPLYDERLNYEEYCQVRIASGTTYICIKANGPDTESGVQPPATSEEYWISGTGKTTTEIYQGLVALQVVIDRHIADKKNPHRVTKEQIGLGNLPNSVSDSIDLDDPNTLATSKAVHDLNEAIKNNPNIGTGGGIASDECLAGQANLTEQLVRLATRVTSHIMESDRILMDLGYNNNSSSTELNKYVPIIKKLTGHELSIHEEKKALQLDDKLVYDPSSGSGEEDGKYASYATVNEGDDVHQVIENVQVPEGAIFTVVDINEEEGGVELP